MSNLGAYQTMTVWAKKVGGPTNLVVILLGTGYVIGKFCEVGVEKIRCLNQQNRYVGKVFNVDGIYSSEDGLELSFGDKYEVLEQDGEAVLIEKVGDANNPYMVSAEILKKSSDFN